MVDNNFKKKYLYKQEFLITIVNSPLSGRAEAHPDNIIFVGN